MNYEINFLILQSKTEGLAEIRQKIKKIIEEKNGKITDELIYEKRKLSYEINHEGYGFFTVYRFDIEKDEEDNDSIKLLKNDLNLASEIARYIIVRSDELPALHEKKEERKENSKEINKDKKDGNIEVKKVATQKISSKEEISKEDLERELKKKDEKPKKKDKTDDASLNDLDKKLDEILNI